MSIPNRETVLNCLRQFLSSTGRPNVALTESTHLINDLGLTSDEGVDFVLDLCEAFGFDFPQDFNPFVHDDGRRGRRLGEMIRAVVSHVPAKQEVVT